MSPVGTGLVVDETELVLPSDDADVETSSVDIDVRLDIVSEV